MNNWIIFTIVAGSSSVAFNFISRYVLKDGHDSTAYSWWFELFRFLIFLPFIIIFPIGFKSISTFLLFVVIGVSEFFSVYFYMKMHSHTELSVSTIVSQFRLIWVPITAFIFLGEKLSKFDYLGIFFIFLGSVAINLKRKGFFTRGIKFALISSIFTAVNSTILKPAANIFSPFAVAFAMSLPSLIIFPLKMKDAKRRILNLGKIKGKNIFIAALFNAFTVVFFVLAMKTGYVGKVTALFQSMMVLQVLIGIIVLNEKEGLTKKLIGIGSVLIGLYLLV
jgi:drug/metabolite transporter (DMT)-like permease